MLCQPDHTLPVPKQFSIILMELSTSASNFHILSLNRYQTKLYFPLHVDFLTQTGHLMRRDCKSVSGYCLYYLGSLVLWSSWKQRTVSTSSTESEYYALTNTIKKAIWMTFFLSFTKIPSPKPFLIFCDNQSTYTIANIDAISSQAKHIDVHHHFICQNITDSDGFFTTVWIPTSDMTSDIFTKPLSSTLFLHHCEAMGVIHC